MVKSIKILFLLFATVVISNSFADLSTGLVAHWTFNERAGTTVSDTSGNGHHATIYGLNDTGAIGDSVWVNGYTGSGIRTKTYDDDYYYWQIRVPYSSQLDIKLEKTISAWVKYYRQPSGDWEGINVISMRHPSIGCFTKPNNYKLVLRNNGGNPTKTQISYATRCGHVTDAGLGCVDLIDSSWHHVAVTHSSDSLTKTYLDGVLIDTATLDSGNDVDSFNLYLGVMRSLPSDNFVWGDMVMDEVRLYNRALSHAEIAELAENEDAPDRQKDSLALVALFDSTGGENWNNHTNWKTCEPIDTWYGVTVANNRVTELRFYNNNLGGVLPPEIGNLTKVEIITFMSNNISGSIPKEIGNLTELSILGLNFNSFSDSIPSEIGNLTKLTKLYVNRNNLTGSIPASLENLDSLVHLYMSYNQLSGSVPTWFGNFSKLEHLSLAYNDLEDTIPASFGNLSQLKQLEVNYNNFSGELPSSMGSLSNLVYILMLDNDFSSLGDSLVNLPSSCGVSLLRNKLCNLSNELKTWCDSKQSGWEATQSCP